MPEARRCPALKRALKSELKQRSAARGIKRPRVVMTSCMDICPKRAVVAASATTLARGEYLLLGDDRGTAEAAALLMRPGETCKIRMVGQRPLWHVLGT